jgi:hypothetical protein
MFKYFDAESGGLARLQKLETEIRAMLFHALGNEVDSTAVN